MQINVRNKLAEDHGHHQMMEEIGRNGSDLYLRKTAKGAHELFLKRQSKSY